MHILHTLGLLETCFHHAASRSQSCNWHKLTLPLNTEVDRFLKAFGAKEPPTRTRAVDHGDPNNKGDI